MEPILENVIGCLPLADASMRARKTARFQTPTALARLCGSRDSRPRSGLLLVFLHPIRFSVLSFAHLEGEKVLTRAGTEGTEVSVSGATGSISTTRLTITIVFDHAQAVHVFSLYSNCVVCYIVILYCNPTGL